MAFHRRARHFGLRPGSPHARNSVVIQPEPSPTNGRTHALTRLVQLPGPVMPISGAEVRTKHGVILRAFVDLAGREATRIAILPTASADPTAGRDYVEVFRQIGAAAVSVVAISSREEANRDALVD